METTKKIIFSIVIVCLVAGSSTGAFYLFKKYLVKKEVAPELVTTVASTSPEAVIPGYKQDTSMKIPEIFPDGLIPKDDIIFIITSFSVAQEGNSQYTFKYQSKKNITETLKYFNTYLKGSNWQAMYKPEISTTSAVITSRKGENEKLSITISNLGGTVVDVTYIK